MILVVHGGAGSKKPTKNALKKISESLSSGYKVLTEGGPALDAVNLKEMTPLRAARQSLKRLLNIGGRAGVIVINKKGLFAILHSTTYLAAGHVSKKGLVIKERFGMLG